MSQGIKVEVAASYDAAFSVGGSSLTDVQKQEAETFSSLKENQHTFSTGSKPPSDGDVNTWVSQSVDDPMPLRYEVKRMSNLFNKNGVGQYRDDYMTLKTNIDKALGIYCQTLLEDNKVPTCSALPDDPK